MKPAKWEATRRVMHPSAEGLTSSSAHVFDALLLGLHLGNDNFENHRLALRDKLPLSAWQLGELRQFQPLHDRFNSPQIMSANGNLVRGKDELEVLLVATTVEFRKDEMVVRQQQ